MTDPKPSQWWACFRPDGGIIKHTLERSEDLSKAVLCSYFALDPLTLFIEMGYSVRRVTITPDHESEK